MNTEYKVAKGRSTADLERSVSQCLTEGWTLLGGVSVSHRNEYEVLYAQALMKRSPEADSRFLHSDLAHHRDIA